MMMCFGTGAVVSFLWGIVTFSITFGPSPSTDDILGWGDYATVDNIGPLTNPHPAAPTITLHTYSMYQLMFAIITVAIICGAVVGKMKWTYWMAFAALWHVGVYCPLAHWIFLPSGWLNRYGLLDFAGGMVIHVSSGVSAFVLAWLLGGKVPTQAHVPHNVPFVLLGAALLWFGWFGFNAGSALSSGYVAGLAFTTTQYSAAAACFTWNLMEIAFAGDKFGMGRPTAVGSATGIVAGLVGVTPGAGLVSPMWGLFIGVFTSASCFFMPKLMKRLTGVDDVLDCFALHGIGGMVGTALTGLFANTAFSGLLPISGAFKNHEATYKGSFYGSAVQLGIQCAGISVTILYSVVCTVLIYGVLWAVAKVLGDTVYIPEDQRHTADVSQHGESAYFTGSLRKAPMAVRTPAVAEGAMEGAAAGATASTAAV